MTMNAALHVQSRLFCVGLITDDFIQERWAIQDGIEMHDLGMYLKSCIDTAYGYQPLLANRSSELSGVLLDAKEAYLNAVATNPSLEDSRALYFLLMRYPKRKVSRLSAAQLDSAYSISYSHLGDITWDRLMRYVDADIDATLVSSLAGGVYA
jgi:hypothetical protein